MSAATRLDPGLVRGAMSGAARNGPAREPFGQQLHVLVPAAPDQPAELFGCERKTWIIIDRTPHSRAEEPSNQASEPPHVNSLAPASNLSVCTLFLLHDRDCKRPPSGPHQKKFGERIISSACATRRIRRSARNRRCPRDRSERRSRQSCRRDSPSRRRS